MSEGCSMPSHIRSVPQPGGRRVLTTEGLFSVYWATVLVLPAPKNIRPLIPQPGPICIGVGSAASVDSSGTL